MFGDRFGVVGFCLAAVGARGEVEDIGEGIPQEQVSPLDERLSRSHEESEVIERAAMVETASDLNE